MDNVWNPDNSGRNQTLYERTKHSHEGNHQPSKHRRSGSGAAALKGHNVPRTN